MGDNPTILVTGSNGQLGKELKQLSTQYPEYNFVFLSHEDLPIQNLERVKSIFNTYHPQVCINCSAYTAVDKAEEEIDLAFLVNGKAVGLLAGVCNENYCGFIHISTDYVFDGTSAVPYKEDDLVNPQSVYGASKLEGENLALKNNPFAIIIRTSWVYSEFGKNFVKTMLKLMSERDVLNVVDDQVGSPTYAADLAGMIIEIIRYGKIRINFGMYFEGFSDPPFRWHPGIYHYCNKGTISWYDFAVAIKELIKSNCKINPISTSQYPTPAKRPAYSVLDTSKIQDSFGIQIKDWKERLKVCLSRIK